MLKARDSLNCRWSIIVNLSRDKIVITSTGFQKAFVGVANSTAPKGI